MKVKFLVCDMNTYLPFDQNEVGEMIADHVVEVDEQTAARWNKVIDEFWDIQNEIDEVIEEQEE